MIFTSKYISLTAPTTGRGKSGFFTLGEVAKKKLYTAEHIPSSPGEWGLIFTLLPLALAAGGIPSNCREMAHSATVRSGITDPQGTPQCALGGKPVQPPRNAASDRPNGTQTHNNLMKPYRRVYYGQKFGVNLNGDLFQGSACISPGRSCHHERS